MTFGLIGFLFAGLAAGIPVVLHMINRQKVKDLPFPTLRFLRISVERTRQRKRIHDLLLMLVRMAALLLIALALAKPTLTRLSALWSAGGDSAVVIVLDNSASMGTVDRGRVRFRTALSAAEQIMDELDDGDQVALLLASGLEYPDEGRLDATGDKVRQMLNQWMGAPSDTDGISYEQADLGTQITQARKLLAQSDAANKQIFVLTDRQRLCWDNLVADRGGGTGEEEVQEGELQEEEKDPHPNPLAEGEGMDVPDIMDVPVIIVDCNREPKTNVAITDVKLEAAMPVAGRPVAATVELFNAAEVAQQRHVELYVDGAKTTDTSPAIDIPPRGKATHKIEFTFPQGGLHLGEVQLVGGDGSMLDDRRFFTMEVDQGIPVAVVKPGPHEIPYLEDTFYVEQALAPAASGDWALRTTILSAADLLAEPLGNYKVVFCVNLPAPDAETAQRLRDYVTAGGNLVWIGGDNVVVEDYNRMNRQQSEQLLPAPLVGIRTPGVDGDRDSWQISFLDADYPPFRRLVEPASLYQSVLVYEHVQFEEGGARVLARLDDGEPLLAERKVEDGRVFMLGTSAHVDWSNLPLRPIFMPLLVRLTLHLADAEQVRRQTVAGSSLVLPLDEGRRPLAVEVIPPTGETLRLPTDDQPGAEENAFRYDDTHQVGVYRLRPLEGTNSRQVAFSVNLDADETNPEEISREELQERFGSTLLVFAEDPDDLSSTFASLREGKSLWDLFLSGVLVVLVFETFLSNRFSPKRDEAQTDRPPPGMRRLARKGRPAA